MPSLFMSPESNAPSDKNQKIWLERQNKTAPKIPKRRRIPHCGGGRSALAASASASTEFHL